ncbi:MAG: lamin tail domain-containing protein [Deltaproteobacteria bacterium]|nr:lamin tail domain-containing protein [Deltaproteobacteria bacterium]
MGLVALAACGADAERRGDAGADGDTRDVVFTEVIVPDALDATDGATSTDVAPEVTDAPVTEVTGADADEVTGATEVSDAADAETVTPDTVTPDAEPEVAETADASDAAEELDARDTTDAPETTPDPFCGDDVCDPDEDCLACDDCACPERCGADLFLSEYLEGPTGYNKALEITNATGRAVDLAGYAIWKITNGGTWGETAPLALSGTLEAGASFVLCHTSASATILAACDLASGTSTMEFNGDDALALARQGVIIDVIGVEGDDPGDAFAAGGVADATKDHRLVRRAAVVEGSADWGAAAGQWDVLPYDEAGLGAHAVAATCELRLPPPAVLNEIRLGAGAADFIEVAAVDAPVDLAGWRIVTTGGAFTFPAGAAVAAGGLVAVTRGELGFGLGQVDIVWLQDAAGVQQDVVGVTLAAIGDDASWGRLPDVTGGFQGLSLATPGAANADPDHLCGDDTCDDDEDCVTCSADCGTCRPIPGELVVTEVLAEPTAGPEWFEVTSVATVPLELAGLVVIDNGSDFHPIDPPGGSWIIAPGGRVVLGSAAAPHVDLVYAGVALEAADDAIVLAHGVMSIDGVAWASAPTPPGTAWSLDPAATTADDNDAPDAWCAAVDPGPDGQLGTPGEPNPACVDPVCGDDTCNGEETCGTCPGDCGPCEGCAPQLFISEYVEGESGSNKKAIEIANFTGQAVNLGQYVIRKITNGGGTWLDADALALTGSLPHGQVWVVCNASSIPELLALCDVTSGSQALTFNGNDAVALAYGSTVIDTIGEETAPDPSAWTVDGVALATQDHVLVRRPTVLGPTTDWATSSATGWTVLAPGQYQGLGAHDFGFVCTP